MPRLLRGTAGRPRSGAGWGERDADAGDGNILTILPDPEAALPAGITEAFDPVNWRSLAPEAGWNSVPALAEAYADTAGRPGSGPMSYVVDRGGRLAAIFHGTDFGYVNMILYVNGLTNVHPARDTGFWARVREVLP
jgi:hypothetical protein